MDLDLDLSARIKWSKFLEKAGRQWEYKKKTEKQRKKSNISEEAAATSRMTNSIL